MGEEEETSTWAGDLDFFADPEEKRVLFAALDSFAQYRRAAHYNITHIRRQNFYALPSSQWTLLSKPPFSILNTLSAVDDAIDANADIADAILWCGLASFGMNIDSNAARTAPYHDCATPLDLDKARSTIRQLFRDWSELGSQERAATYGTVMGALNGCFSDIDPSLRGKVRVLVPGAGLGRLVYELIAEGYTVEGNEISYHQLLASSFILNHTTSSNQCPLYPFALSFSNHLSRRNQLQRVMIPDIHPGSSLEARIPTDETPATERMSMTAADFCVLYQQEEYHQMFDAVCTVFFIDTAPNVLAYIETVKKCLKPGGVWINLGPLLWHFQSGPPKGSKRDDSDSSIDQTIKVSHHTLEVNAGIGEAGSVELTDEEIIKLLEHYDFQLERHEPNVISTGYIQDPNSMLQNIYRPSFWIARKKGN